MNTALFAIAALAAATPALAAADPAVRVAKGDDRLIHYTVEMQRDGSYVLASTPREPEFRLRVKNGHVTGHVEGRSVSFAAPRSIPVRAIAD